MKKQLILGVLLTVAILLVSCGKSPELSTTETTMGVSESTSTTVQSTYNPELTNFETKFTDPPLPPDILDAIDDVVAGRRSISSLKRWLDNYPEYIVEIYREMGNLFVEYLPSHDVLWITVEDKVGNPPTSPSGVKIGDNKDRVIELYGSDFQEHSYTYESGIHLLSLQYRDGDSYLVFGLENGKVAWWKFNIHSMLNANVVYEDDG